LKNIKIVVSLDFLKIHHILQLGKTPDAVENPLAYWFIKNSNFFGHQRGETRLNLSQLYFTAATVSIPVA